MNPRQLVTYCDKERAIPSTAFIADDRNLPTHLRTKSTVDLLGDRPRLLPINRGSNAAILSI
jgi:hypothetical protein